MSEQNQHNQKMNKQITLFNILLFSFLPLSSFGASWYFLQFINKNNSQYSLEHPHEFLSERAIARRLRNNVLPDSTDLPVSPHYIAQVAATGVTIHSATKWLNGVTVILYNDDQLEAIANLPFIKRIEYTGVVPSAASVPPSRTKWADRQQATDTIVYGNTLQQTTQLNGQALHAAGYTGKGIHIGVLDAGYRNVNTNPAFYGLIGEQRLLGAISVIDPTLNVYAEDPHGSSVLSIMAGQLPGQYTGVAPQASYLLIQTEYVPTEYKVEIDFWVRGIEIADSMGVDIINSSLGYTEFDDPKMDFTYADMNGKVSRASIAAAMAARKEIIVCNSVGNSGGRAWKYLGSPADAEGILAVGSVTSSGTPSFFSSFGPSADGRTKPEVSATGSLTSIVNPNGTTGTSSGTSFSSPIVAGLAACFLQFYLDHHTNFSVQDVIQAIIASSSKYNQPEEQLGYGIPDFGLAMQKVYTKVISTEHPETWMAIYDPASNRLKIAGQNDKNTTSIIQLWSTSGTLLMSSEWTNTETYFTLPPMQPGIYIVHMHNQSHSVSHKIIIP